MLHNEIAVCAISEENWVLQGNSECMYVVCIVYCMHHTKSDPLSTWTESLEKLNNSHCRKELQHEPNFCWYQPKMGLSTVWWWEKFSPSNQNWLKYYNVKLEKDKILTKIWICIDVVILGLMP